MAPPLGALLGRRLLTFLEGCREVGVRDLVAREYFIPGGESQRGVGRAPAFRVARCQTWTIWDSGQSPMMSHRDGF